jgi:hypothetical protein
MAAAGISAEHIAQAARDLTGQGSSE